MLDWEPESNEVFQDGDWVLVKTWAIRYEEGCKSTSQWVTIPYMSIVHCCYGEAWRVRVGKRAIRDKRCDNCHKPVPAEMLGLQALANWER